MATVTTSPGLTVMVVMGWLVWGRTSDQANTSKPVEELGSGTSVTPAWMSEPAPAPDPSMPTHSDIRSAAGVAGLSDGTVNVPEAAV